MIWLGRIGCFRGSMPASCGVLLPFFVLQGLQAVIRFSHVSSPPFERGTMWSIVKVLSVCPQYWHWKLSLLKIFFMFSIIFLYGTRT